MAFNSCGDISLLSFMLLSEFFRVNVYIVYCVAVFSVLLERIFVTFGLLEKKR